MSRIEDMAVAYISSVLNDERQEAAAPPALRADLVWRKHTLKVAIEGRQRDLRQLPGELLLKPLMFPRNYRLSDSIGAWVTRLLTGGTTIADVDQLQKDLGFDIAGHTRNLQALRTSSANSWRLLLRGDLVGLYLQAPDAPDQRTLLRAVVRDHALLLGVVRARLLAEYLRRLATEPMGPRFVDDDPVWARQGTLLVDRLVKPARSLEQLLGMAGGSSGRKALDRAVASGRLAYDHRLLPMARRVYQRIGPAAFDATADQRITANIRTTIAPLTAITATMLRDDGMGKEGFAHAQLGLSVPEAVTVLALNLIALPGRLDAALRAIDEGQQVSVAAPTPAALLGTANRVRRIATALKAISRCDRHIGDTSTGSDNKAGRKLLRRVHKLLDDPKQPHGMVLLQISPAEWLRR
ncbi:hypothetical protein [Sphingomonas sp. CARO-RG-8B-R24-01]|uniref:hypothetical protein n=1 Tax=Sphingomonas sp. CARO-RG-8B-R24-01 TaxID=2914831 RepID=UPI001F590398|nr:hypothetical protein [Sphingomonas sp. CARO-RG-8B-R24-01]